MEAKIIDTYNYCSSTNNRTNLYKKDVYTDNELLKTYAIRGRLLNFIQVVENSFEPIPLLESTEIYDYIDRDAYLGIFYLEGIGYISKGNYDRDIVDVYYYGKSEEEAFKTAIYEYVMHESHYFELWNREELNKDFSNRFLNGEVNEDDYHGPFFFAEHSLQLLRNFYGNNIPEEFINEFEEYVKEVSKLDVKFNYETNRFEQKGKILEKGVK
jgi:hypothetical protein